MSMSYDAQAEYDREYDPRYLIPGIQRYVQWYADESAAARRELPCTLDIHFGPARDEVLDVFPSSEPSSPIVVFVHGGYWQSSSSREFSFVARGLHARSITVVLTNYSLCPGVTIADITRQTRAALSWIYREAHRFNGDRRRIFVAGHSAGGQQVGMLLAPRWHKEHGLPDDLIKGAITVSGIFDLRPLRQCSMQRVLQLTPELVQGQSPQFNLPQSGPPLLVSFGADESAEFRRQSTEYLKAWQERGLSGRLLVQPGRNHFDALTGLSDANSQLCDAVVSFITQREPARASTRQASPIPPIESVPRSETLPASFAQQRLWFLTQLHPSSHAYNEPIMVHMDQLADPAVLKDCLTEITRRHEAWRTVFPALDGEPLQRIMPPSPFHLDTIDLRPVPEDQREHAIHRVAAEHARRPFSLAEGPLVRALLIMSGEKESRLVVTAHHTVVDGVSFFGVFLPELSALYAAFSHKKPSPLPEPCLHYADFAAWQRRWLIDEVLGPKLAYWRTQLANLSLPSLPLDFPRPPVPSGRGARAPVAISAELTRKLRELGHGAGVSLFTTLLAAWKTLLFRYTDQCDIVVGSAAAGRPSLEFEGLIGFFNNNLVLRTQLDGSLPFLALLPKVGEVLRDARAHQEVPFEKLVAALGAGRQFSENPLYNTTFLLMPPPPSLGATPGWSARRFDLGVAKVDLYLELHQRPAGLAGHLEYSTELFSAETIARMANHFRTLLESIVRDPSQRLSELTLLPEEERQTLARFQGPASPALPDEELMSLEQLFAAQAARSPEAIALEQGDIRISYAELDARANCLARYLRQQGIGPETLVGLCIERCVDAMVGILGVLKAGGAYVPLDPGYPAERLRFMVEDADLKLVLTNHRNARVLPEHSGRKVLLDEDWPAIAEHGAEAVSPIATAQHVAYVIYTSGSTGRPKGAMVERRGLSYFAKTQEKLFGLGVGSRILQFLALGFDGSVWDMALAWSVGATLVLARPEDTLPGPRLTEFLEQNNIHLIVMTPSALSVTHQRALPLLHTIVSVGEVLPAELVARWAPGRRFFNGFGPTECTIATIAAQCHAGEGKPAIGRPFEYVCAYVLDGELRPLPIGVPGELYLGGPAVGRGYLGRPELTTARFVPSPFPETKGTRLYKTGDRVKWHPDGSLDYLGRLDRQVKLRGFRIELGEIEAVLAQHPAVGQAKVTLEERPGNDSRIVAYIVPAEKNQGPQRESSDPLSTAVRAFVNTKLPVHMVPAAFVLLDALPLLPSGKVDFKALPVPSADPRAAEREAHEASAALRSDSLPEAIADIWREVLGIQAVGLDDAFFAVGGHSLALARVQTRLSARLGLEVDIMTLMLLPTIRQLSAHLQDTLAPKVIPPAVKGIVEAKTPAPLAERPQAVAIVGMAIRAPGVSGPDDLWEVLCAGRETISILDPEVLIAHGADPARVRRPDFVSAEGVLERADHFDAALFGYSEADAACMDPQRRLFLECAYEALEHAGYDPALFQGRIGVFGGCGRPLHWMGPVLDALGASADDHERLRAQTLNSPDFLTAGVAFKLGLRGPAVTVQTACSTSLSAIHLARRSLLAGECDMVLAGGSSITSLREADRGFLGAAPGLVSADGRCRPFDADANGTVRSSGVALVVMKRLAAALADGDTIHAVVLGSAMNNDGADKLGFSAPGENGIAAVVEQAYQDAGVEPGSVGFVEAHGTGTRLGDPTEVRALTRAFRRATEQRGFCALGSMKGNVGHLDTAAGAGSLIKATLALWHESIPPQPGFRTPNPLLDLPSTPFFVNSVPLPWPRGKVGRRAGISALGLGGTNVHVVMEEAPPGEPPSPGRPYQLICLSAHSASALTAAMRRLGEHLSKHPGCNLADVAHTLAVGRTQHAHRSICVVRTVQEAQDVLTSAFTSLEAAATQKARRDRPVVFLFPGHGVHYLRMGIEVYETEPTFRAEVDRCFDLAQEVAGLDLRALWRGELPDGERTLAEMPYSQTLLFVIEYALAQQAMQWGVRPVAMLGHSLGEYVAACVAGVFSVRDALALLAIRGQLAESTAPGSMLVAFAEAHRVEPLLNPEVAIATYLPGSVVISGFVDDVERVRTRLGEAGILTNAIRASRAGHSPAMLAVRNAFRQRLSEVELQAPRIPIVSNRTGRLMTDEQARSPDAWADHLCSPVRLEESFDTVLELGSPICLELGPGASLGSSLKGHRRFVGAGADVVQTMPDYRRSKESSSKALLSALGRAWVLGVAVDWSAFYGHERRRRVPLPTYPFEARQCSLAPASTSASTHLDARAMELVRELAVRSVDDCPGLRPRLEALCAGLVLDFFARRLGNDLGQDFMVETLQTRLGILPEYAPMLHYLLETLEREDFASRPAPGAVRFRTEKAGRSGEFSSRLQRDIPASEGLIRFVTHCVGSYDEVLSGAADALATVFPGGTNKFFMECMHHLGPPHWHVYVSLAREAVLDMVARRRGRTTRILEVGAGHGTLTWALAESLRGADIEYHFTDIGRSFLLRADAEIQRRGFSWMKAYRFDLNRPPAEQELLDRYDVILGLDSVHVSANLRVTLENLHGLLLPGGALMLIESTRSETWNRLAIGLLPGYWDIEHSRGGFWLGFGRWESELRSAGFSTATGIPQDARKRESDGYGFFIAQKALEARQPRVEVPRGNSKDSSLNTPAARAQKTMMDADDNIDKESVESLWRRLLGCSHVPTGVSFFELGGDSLLAVQLLAELQVKTGRNIKLKQFYAEPTVGGLQALLRSSSEPEPLSASLTPPHRPLSDDQESDEASVRAFLDQYIEWMRYRDAPSLCSIFADDCVNVTSGESILVGSALMRQHYTRKLPGLLDVRIHVHDWHVLVFSGGQSACAIGRVDSDQTFAAGGRRVAYRGTRVSLVLARHANRWYVVHSHYSLPVGGHLETLG